MRQLHQTPCAALASPALPYLAQAHQTPQGAALTPDGTKPNQCSVPNRQAPTLPVEAIDSSWTMRGHMRQGSRGTLLVCALHTLAMHGLIIIIIVSARLTVLTHAAHEFLLQHVCVTHTNQAAVLCIINSHGGAGTIIW